MQAAAATGLTAALNALVAAGPSVLNPLGLHLNQNSQMKTAVNALLTQALLNPAMAAQIAASIASIQGVPAGVLAYTNEMPLLANDHTGYITAITQAQAALEAATSHSTLGNILTNLGL